MSNTEKSPPAAETNEVNIEWSYSGKALRAQAMLFVLLSLLLMGGGIYATFAGWFKPYLLAWYIITGCLALLWGYHYTVYFYRTLTIRYKLTDKHFYAYRGLFIRVCNSMELIQINDVQYSQSLVDRLLNGGVGNLVIYCPIDKTDGELVLKGIENPKEIFKKIDSLRTALRTKRAILTGGA